MIKRVIKIACPLILLFFCAALIQVERQGVRYEESNRQTIIQGDVLQEQIEDPECLILFNGNEEISQLCIPMMERVLADLRVMYVEKNLAAEKVTKEELTKYQTVVLAMEDWNILGEQIVVLSQWVADGGRMMNMITPALNATFFMIADKMGITDTKDGYGRIRGFIMQEDIMIGAPKGKLISYVEPGEEDLMVSLALHVTDDTKVYMKSDTEIPLLWEQAYEKGKFVFFNETILEKYQRGFYTVAYSLLKDTFLYPVINASAFYLDDFPSPVPAGDGSYIKKDFGVDINTFYTSIWWPDLLTLSEKYGVKFTGLLIEDYNDNVKAPFIRQQSTMQIASFGNVLLKHGGELGLHGYNHMPLCLKGIDDQRKYGSYKLWKREEDMIESLQELDVFSKSLFPNERIQVYVPPSNIISEKGIEALKKACPDIKILASTYLKDADGKAYEQEFGVREDGLIYTPRIVSGCNLDQYQQLLALSELNFHFVQSHFMHPDDTLDTDRGASLGWKKLREQLEEYMNYIKTSAPELRNTTGTEMGQAVENYAKESFRKTETKEKIELQVYSPTGEMYLFFRVNKGKFKSISGGNAKEIASNLYLLHVTDREVTIKLEN